MDIFNTIIQFQIRKSLKFTLFLNVGLQKKHVLFYYDGKVKYMYLTSSTILSGIKEMYENLWLVEECLW